MISCKLSMNHAQEQQQGPVYIMTMKSDHGRWVFAMVRLDSPTSMVQFLKNNQFTKILGPSLVVNRMRFKRNDLAPKSKYVFFNICPKGIVLKKNWVWPFFCFLFSSSCLPWKNFIASLLLWWYFSEMGTCLFLHEHLFCLSHDKTRWTMLVDDVGFQICLLGTSNSMVTLTFFPQCKLTWSSDEFNN